MNKNSSLKNSSDIQGDVGRPQLVLCNCPNPQTAQQLATLLVKQQLAACVNCLPGVQSVYEWQGQIECAEETMLIIKTTANRYSPMQEAIVKAHPYDVPEIIAIDISDGLPAYLQWLAASL